MTVPRVTHTYSILDVTEETFTDVKQRLERVNMFQEYYHPENQVIAFGTVALRAESRDDSPKLDADIQEVFRKIAARERVHGDFLTCFAEAYTRADFANKPLLRDAALRLIAKYKLAGYATEPAITTFPPER